MRAGMHQQEQSGVRSKPRHTAPAPDVANPVAFELFDAVAKVRTNHGGIMTPAAARRGDPPENVPQYWFFAGDTA